MSRKTLALLSLLWLLATVTLGLQSWVGSKTIYAAGLESRREQLHESIMANQAPGGGTWAQAGALSIQKRVGVVYLAEGLRRISGFPISTVYKLLDSVFLFGSLVALFFYLRKWLPDVYCLIGLLYFCAVLPLTYFFQLFHPWDRPQLALWIILLYLVEQRRFLMLALGLVLSILVKFDTVLLPALYALVHWRKGDEKRVLLESIGLLLLAFGTNSALNHLFPDPHDVSRFSLSAVGGMLLSNLHKIRTLHVSFPPLLVLALPALLALAGLRHKGRFVVACTLFGLGLSAVHLALTNYEEIRAHIVVLVLFMPAALMTLRRLLEPPERVDIAAA